jgi:hypothetical protein
MAKGPSRDELFPGRADDGNSHRFHATGLPAGGDRDTPRNAEDREWEQERHQRRMQLMRMRGETDRLEARMYVMWFVAAALAVVAIIGAILS